MSNFFREVLDWSEAWAPLLPLIVLLYLKSKTPYLNPVRIFLLSAFILNLFLDILWKFGKPLGVTSGDFLSNNNFIYNISSVLRLLLFAWFFIGLRQRFMHRIKILLPIGFLVFVFINFIFFQDFFPQGNNFFSSRLLTAESAILLFFCMQYYIYLILEEKNLSLIHQPGFWVVTGLSVYVAANFFIFLFWEYLSVKMKDFALGIWDIHNITFIIFCSLITVQFFLEHKKPAAS
jgi:hypothetical protein